MALFTLKIIEGGCDSFAAWIIFRDKTIFELRFYLEDIFHLTDKSTSNHFLPTGVICVEYYEKVELSDQEMVTSIGLCS